jgi:hypothetical protein
MECEAALHAHFTGHCVRGRHAAMEQPVIATPVPGCMDVVENRMTETLVPACAAADITEAMRSNIEHDPAAVRAASGGNGCSPDSDLKLSGR